MPKVKAIVRLLKFRFAWYILNRIVQSKIFVRDDSRIIANEVEVLIVDIRNSYQIGHHTDTVKMEIATKICPD